MAIITKEGEHGAPREVAAPSVMLNYINSMLHVHLNHDNAKKMQVIQRHLEQPKWDLNS